jgi:putative hydrolase of the HAD superfamily
VIASNRSGGAEPTQIRGVVFDLFHTLTGRESERSDLPWTADVLGVPRARWDEALLQSSRRRLTGEERDPYRIVSTLARALNPEIDDARIRAAVTARVQRFRETLYRIPVENLDTLHELRGAGFRLGLISNADAMEVAAWADSPMSGLFDSEVFSCDAGCVKPEAAIYDRCLRELGLRGEECLFIGDGGSNELAGAKEAGMTAVFVSGVVAELWPDSVSRRLAQSDHHVRAVPDVLSLLESLKTGSASREA